MKITIYERVLESFEVEVPDNLSEEELEEAVEAIRVGKEDRGDISYNVTDVWWEKKSDE